MRHSDINLTMARYSHVFKGQESAAVAKLPDLSAASRERQQAKATGTEGNEIAWRFTWRLQDGKQRISMDGNGQKAAKTGDGKNAKETALSSEKSGFPTKDRGGKAKAAVGFEPTNNGFAKLSWACVVA